MAGMTKSVKNGLAALAIFALAVPAAGAFATAEDAAGAEDAALSAEQVEQARQIFNDWSCGACHVLTDAGGNGHIGPSLDGNATLDHDYVLARVSDGQGAMPGFGGMMSEEELDLLASYIVQARK